MKKREHTLSIPPLKQEARRLQTERGYRRHQALDLVAQKNGYQNWSLLAKHNPEDDDRPGAVRQPVEVARAIAEIERIYSDVARFFEASESPLARPVSQNGRTGFAALYTAPRYRPDLLIVGQNPGNFGPNDRVWDDEANRLMMSGRIPSINSYLVHQHNFGRELQRYFAGPDAHLLAECVGLNIWFFQAQGTPTPPADLAAFCEQAARRIIQTLQPRVILCLSRKAFDVLRTAGTATFGAPDAPAHTSVFGNIPMICGHHPTGRWTRQLAAKSIPAALAWVNGTLTGNQADRQGTPTPESAPVMPIPLPVRKETAMLAEVPAWSESFSARRFSFAHEAAQYILDNTKGAVSDENLNAFVLSWASAIGKPLLNTERQNRNRVVKYRKSWLKHGHCRDMQA